MSTTHVYLRGNYSDGNETHTTHSQTKDFITGNYFLIKIWQILKVIMKAKRPEAKRFLKNERETFHHHPLLPQLSWSPIERKL